MVSTPSLRFWIFVSSIMGPVHAYALAYRNFFKQHCPENGLPARFTVHVVDVPDQGASYEFYATALYQKAMQR